MRWRSRMFFGVGMGLVVTAAVADERADPWKSVARYDLVYRVRLQEIAPAAGNVSVWVPYPAETPDQRVVAAHIDSPWPERLTREEKYGNRMVYLEGKAECARGPSVA